MKLTVGLCCEKAQQAQKGIWPPRTQRTQRKGGLFDRIYRMIRILATDFADFTDGALRELLCNSLRVETGRALSERAPSGPACFDPATLSPCEAWSWVTAVTVMEGRTRKFRGGGFTVFC